MRYFGFYWTDFTEKPPFGSRVALFNTIHCSSSKRRWNFRLTSLIWESFSCTSLQGGNLPRCFLIFQDSLLPTFDIPIKLVICFWLSQQLYSWIAEVAESKQSACRSKTLRIGSRDEQWRRDTWIQHSICTFRCIFQKSAFSVRSGKVHTGLGHKNANIKQNKTWSRYRELRT